MMSTENKNNTTNEETKNNQQQGEQQQTDNNQQQAPAPEKEDGFFKKAWNKVKKPLGIAAAVVGGVAGGVLLDRTVLNKQSNSQDGAGAADQSTGDSAQ